jgi:hypothetical protein
MGNAMFEENSNSDFWVHRHSLELLDYHGLYGPQMDELWYRCVYDSLTDPGCEYFKEKSEFIRT